jgi:hypothetical protein
MVLALFKCDSIKAIKNATFHFRTASHLINASAINLTNRSKYTIQQNMAKHDVRTYIIKLSEGDSDGTVSNPSHSWGVERYAGSTQIVRMRVACG